MNVLPIQPHSQRQWERGVAFEDATDGYFGLSAKNASPSALLASPL